MKSGGKTSKRRPPALEVAEIDLEAAQKRSASARESTRGSRGNSRPAGRPTPHGAPKVQSPPQRAATRYIGGYSGAITPAGITEGVGRPNASASSKFFAARKRAPGAAPRDGDSSTTETSARSSGVRGGRPQRPHTIAGRTAWEHLAGIICTSTAMFLLARLGGAFAAATAKGVSPLWPPPGLLLAVTLSYRRIAGVWAAPGAFAYATWIDQRGFVAAACKVASEVTYPLVFLAVVDAMLGKSTTTKWQQPPTAVRSIAPFDSVKGVVATCIAAVAASAVTATLGTVSLLIFEDLPSELGFITFLTWTIGDLTGAVLGMPFFRAWGVKIARADLSRMVAADIGQAVGQRSPKRVCAAMTGSVAAVALALVAEVQTLCKCGTPPTVPAPPANPRGAVTPKGTHGGNSVAVMAMSPVASPLSAGIDSTPGSSASMSPANRMAAAVEEGHTEWLGTAQFRVVEAVLWLAATVGFVLIGTGSMLDISFAASVGHSNTEELASSSFVYLTIPPALYGAVRFGLLGSTLATMIAGAAMLGTTLAFGKPYGDALLLDAFLVVLSVTSLLFSAVMSRLHGVVARLRRTKARLAAATAFAEETAKSKIAFLANMSHELRTPLNGILGMSDIVLESGLAPEQVACMEDVQTSARHLLNVLNDILLLSRMEFTTQEAKEDPESSDSDGRLDFLLSPHVVDLLRTVEDSSAIAYDQSRHGHIRLVLNAEPDVPAFVVADATRLKQILCNLLSNALKFVEEGEVEISIRRLTSDEEEDISHQLAEAGVLAKSYLSRSAGLLRLPSTDRTTATEHGVNGDGFAVSPRAARVSPASVSKSPSWQHQQYLRFSVRDTGVGIPPEKQPLVFEAFRQADNSVARRYGGTGLGLAITYRLIEAMGGILALNSAVGVGSEFWFVLPVFVPQRRLSAVGTSGSPPAKSSAVAPTFAEIDDFSSRSAALKGKTAVVMHPNTCAADAIAMWLREAGLEVTSFTMAEEVDYWVGSVSPGREPVMAFVDCTFECPPACLRGSPTSPAGTARSASLADWLCKAYPSARVVQFVPRGASTAPSFPNMTCMQTPVLPSQLRRQIAVVADAVASSDSKPSAPGFSSAGPGEAAHETQGAARKAGGASAAASSVARSLNLRVLLAEDNKINQRVAVKMLQSLGCETVIANDGSEALAELGLGGTHDEGAASAARSAPGLVTTASDLEADAPPQAPFDAVLMDVQMPVLDGIAAARAIRGADLRNRHGNRMPVIALTANAFTSDRDNCEQAGMDGFISKPFSRVTIATALSTALPALVPKADDDA